MKEEAPKNLASLLRRMTRDWWQERLAGIAWGTKLRVTSCCFPGQEPFSEVVTFEYVDNAHLNVTSEGGCRMGLPTCFITKVEIEQPSTWKEV